jgi:hypothetical protein
MTQPAAAVLAFLKEDELGGIALLKPARLKASDASIADFAKAMDRAGAVAPGEAPASVAPASDAAAQPTRVAGASDTGAVDAAAAEQRARRALGLDAPTAAAAPDGGDAILGGLKKLRGVIDRYNLRVNTALSATDGFDPDSMMATQVEVWNYTLWLDVGTKFLGNTTRAFNDLLKSG